MFCRNCGKELDESSVYCPHCGVKTTPEATAVPPVLPAAKIKYCAHCGKQIDEKAVICIHCGIPTGEANENKEPKKINGFGIAGFVVSLVSLWLGWFFCISAIVGLVLSIIGFKNRNKCNSLNGLAIAGLVLGIVATSLWGLYWLIIGSTGCASCLSCYGCYGCYV